MIWPHFWRREQGGSMANANIDYSDLNAVVQLAKALNSRQFQQFVVKYPDRDNYNITMQVKEAVKRGATVVWSMENN